MPTIDYPTDIGIAKYFPHDVQCPNSIIKILFHNFHIICYYIKILFTIIRKHIQPTILFMSIVPSFGSFDASFTMLLIVGLAVFTSAHFTFNFCHSLLDSAEGDTIE